MKLPAIALLLPAAIGACAPDPIPPKPPAPKIESLPATTTPTGVKKDAMPDATLEDAKPLTPPAIPPTPR